jgi:hypothetical protein
VFVGGVPAMGFAGGAGWARPGTVPVTMAARISQRGKIRFMT